ncbi:MAG: TerC family protein [Chloroflexota bacterium]|nr:MAG: TerC family protein [Chloroflexota bacterium]
MLGQVVNIIVIDLVLSGDNAVVIGMAASRLAGRDRRQAILWGVIGAIGLRVLFTALIAVLLGIPLLQVGGGLMLIWIAYKLVRPIQAQARGDVRAASSRVEAIRTIVMADVVMSLDNILAVGGAAHGDVTLLLFGLALSMPLITFGSGFVAWALDRVPALIFLGAAVLAKVAGEMIGQDPIVESALAGLIGDGGVHAKVAAVSWLAWLPGISGLSVVTLVLEGGVTAAVIAAGIVMRARAPRA